MVFWYVCVLVNGGGCSTVVSKGIKGMGAVSDNSNSRGNGNVVPQASGEYGSSKD